MPGTLNYRYIWNSFLQSLGRCCRTQTIVCRLQNSLLFFFLKIGLEESKSSVRASRPRASHASLALRCQLLFNCSCVYNALEYANWYGLLFVIWPSIPASLHNLLIVSPSMLCPTGQFPLLNCKMYKKYRKGIFKTYRIKSAVSFKTYHHQNTWIDVQELNKTRPSPKLHDKMKAWTDLLNKSNTPIKWSKQMNKETAKKYKANTPLRTPQHVSQNLVKISQFCNFHCSFSFRYWKVWACTWLVLCSPEQKVLIMESWYWTGTEIKDL